MKKFKNLRLLLALALGVFLASSFLSSSRLGCCAQGESIWYVHDVIDPTLDEVRWREEGAISQAQSWIGDGSWLEFSKRESLVGANDIFVSMYERFNWTLVKEMYGLPFANFNEFSQYLITNPLYWISDIWQIQVEWYGIAPNTTGIDYSFNDATSEARLWTYYHITRIPEYFLGSERLADWLTGFDLTPISLGSLKIYEFYEDSNLKGTHYNLYFRAPANFLAQHGDNYSITINISPSYRGLTFNMQQVIDINMPPSTEVKEMSPSSLSLPRGNTASFVLSKDDAFPAAFTAVSGPPAKSFNQVIWENASLWVLTPGGWAAIATLIVLSWTAFRGKRIWTRSKLYHRMYNSMVTIYDLYSEDVLKFHQEMGNVSTSIFKLLIEDKITDEQFEKLLVRRDDLLKRAHSEQTRSEK